MEVDASMRVAVCQANGLTKSETFAIVQQTHPEFCETDYKMTILRLRRIMEDKR